MSEPSLQLLTDPASLPPYNESGTLHVVIETPKGSRNKYAFDHKRRVISLRKTLPAGMQFPYDFGFVPSTKADDGDPIDVLLLMDEPAFCGCVVEARLIGVIEGEDQEKAQDGKGPDKAKNKAAKKAAAKNAGKPAVRRNDRLLAVALASDVYGQIEKATDLSPVLLQQMQDFFVTYTRLMPGKDFHCLGVRGAGHAERLVKKAMEAA